MTREEAEKWILEEGEVHGILASTGTAPPNCEVLLQNLLAVIHRDGGHYTNEHGLEKSHEDAMNLSSGRIAKIDEHKKALIAALVPIAALLLSESDGKYLSREVLDALREAQNAIFDTLSTE